MSIGEISPRMFSFNNPFGACEKCSGMGELKTVSAEKIIPDTGKSLRGGAIAVNGFKTIEEASWNGPLIMQVCAAYGYTIDTPICEMSDEALKALLYGTGDKIYNVVRVFGGMFSIEEPAVSTRMGEEKIKRHIATGAEYVTGPDSSCLMHMAGIAKKEKMPIKFIHVVQILAAGL